MSESGISLREIVRERLADLRLGPVAAARASGLERTFIRDLISGKKRTIRGDGLIRLAAALKLDPEKLAIGVAAPAADGPPLGEPPPAAPRETPAPIAQTRGVPVRGTVAGALAHSFRFTGDTVEMVPWPPALVDVRGLYAVFVARNSMAPEHKAGELRFVNPNRPARPGDSVVITTRTHEKAGPEAYIGHLVRSDDEHVVIAKLNPPSNVKFDAAFVEAVEKVMTMNELFGV